MGMELRSSLESKLGVEIPVASLFDEPTVLSLAQVVSESFDNVQRDEDDADSQAPIAERGDPALAPRLKADLVSLGGSQGTGSPLFCVHPVGGDLRCYDGFSRTMRDRPVYGLRAQGLQSGSQAHQTMDAMISDYIRTIREADPNGPYCLMGWSTGGIFAYEIARRLHQDQIPVHSLVMVDTPLPAVFENVDLQDDAKFLVDLVEFTNYFAGTSMEISYQTLREKSETEAISSVLNLAMAHGVLPANTTQEYLHRLINVCKQHVEILQGYWPPPSDLTVQLLLPEDTSMLSEATGQSHADDLGWGDLVQLQRHQVPGHHFTMMTGDNAVVLGETIDDILRQTAPVNADSAQTTSLSQPNVNR
jgi:myxalamid-type polyketide synthase MxaB